jgi:hypothetical protein
MSRNYRVCALVDFHLCGEVVKQGELIDIEGVQLLIDLLTIGRVELADEKDRQALRSKEIVTWEDAAAANKPRRPS